MTDPAAPAVPAVASPQPDAALDPEQQFGELLILSPHLDDAALSAFALVTASAAPEVHTVFDGAPIPPQRTGWDALCGYRDSSAAVADRNAENDAALRVIGAPHASSGLLDTQYLRGPRGGADAEAIQQLVRGWLADHPGGTVAVPAGAGVHRGPNADAAAASAARRRTIRRILGRLGKPLLDWRSRRIARSTRPAQHVDHVYVRDAILDLIPVLPDLDVLLYEDLPYLWGAPADAELARITQQRGVRSTAIELPVDQERKAEAVACYPSQLRFMYAPHGRPGTPAGLPATERYWRLTR